MSTTAHGEVAFAEADRMTKRILLFQTTKWTSAAEMFTTASNFFRLGSDWLKAAEAHVRCAECFEKLKDPEQAAASYVSAATCLRKCDHPDAATYLRVAAGIYSELKQMGTSAKLLKEAGEVHEKFLEFEEALLCYEHAAYTFDVLQCKGFSIGCYLKVAELSGQLDEFERASMIYQKVARDAKTNQVLRWKVKEYLFRAGLMLLCSKDMKAAHRALSTYKSIDRPFTKTAEFAFLRDFIAAYMRHDYVGATQAVERYSPETGLDSWKASIFLYILSQVKDPPSP